MMRTMRHFASVRLDRRAFLGVVAGALSITAGARAASASDLGLLGIRHDGRRLASGEPAGWKLIYFGYTHCPDICPTGLQTIAEAMDRLGVLGERITPVFVTVDPPRDTPPVMAEFVGLFHPRLVGVTPDADELRQMAAVWRIKYGKAETGVEGAYLMDHTSMALLLDPTDAVAGRVSLNLAPEAFAERVAARMSASR